MTTLRDKIRDVVVEHLDGRGVNEADTEAIVDDVMVEVKDCIDVILD